MADIKLKKASREQLVGLLSAERKKNADLNERIASLEKELEDKKIRIENSGSIAEASLSLNGVFEAAEAAPSAHLPDGCRLCCRLIWPWPFPR